MHRVVFSSNHLPARAIAFALVLAMTVSLSLSDLSHANALDPSLVTLRAESVSIPSELGHVEEFFQGRGNRLVVYIQDAHANYSAQKHIASAIDHFTNQYDIPLVALEAADGEVDVSLFRSFPVPEITEHVLDKRMRSGEIGGPEFALTMSKKDLDAVGVDDEELYLKNFKEFMAVMDDQKKGFEFTKNVRTAFESLRSATYSKQHKELDRILEAHRKETLDLISLMKELRRFSVELKIDTKAFLEIQKLFTFLDDSNIQAADQNKIRDYMASIDAEALFLDIERLSLTLKLKMSGTNTERRLITLEHYLNLLERGFDLTLTRRDVKELNELAKEMRAERIFSFLEEAAAENRVRLGPLRAVRDIPVDSFVEHILTFYQTTVKRDEHFTKALLIEMQKKRASSALMIAGGYHRQGLTQRLRKQRISYVVVMPKVDEVGEHEKYLALMKKGANLLRLPSRNTLGFAVRGASAHGPAMINSVTGPMFNEFWRIENTALLQAHGFGSLAELAEAYAKKETFAVYKLDDKEMIADRPAFHNLLKRGFGAGESTRGKLGQGLRLVSFGLNNIDPAVFNAMSAVQSQMLGSKPHISKPTSTGFGAMAVSERDSVEKELDLIFGEAGFNRGEVAGWNTKLGAFVPTTRNRAYAILDALPIPHDRRVVILDAGHGQGEWSLQLAHRFPLAEVIGIESEEKLFGASEQILQAAENWGFVKNGQVKFYQGDFNEERFAGHFQRADFVYYFNAGTNDLKTFAGTLVAQLRPGASLVEYGVIDELRPILAGSDFQVSEITVEDFPYLKVFTRIGFGAEREQTFQGLFDLKKNHPNFAEQFQIDGALGLPAVEKKLHEIVTFADRFVYNSAMGPDYVFRFDSELYYGGQNFLPAELKRLFSDQPKRFGQFLFHSRRADEFFGLLYHLPRELDFIVADKGPTAVARLNNVIVFNRGVINVLRNAPTEIQKSVLSLLIKAVFESYRTPADELAVALLERPYNEAIYEHQDEIDPGELEKYIKQIFSSGSAVGSEENLKRLASGREALKRRWIREDFQERLIQAHFHGYTKLILKFPVPADNVSDDQAVVRFIFGRGETPGHEPEIHIEDYHTVRQNIPLYFSVASQDKSVGAAWEENGEFSMEDIVHMGGIPGEQKEQETDIDQANLETNEDPMDAFVKAITSKGDPYARFRGYSWKRIFKIAEDSDESSILKAKVEIDIFNYRPGENSGNLAGFGAEKLDGRLKKKSAGFFDGYEAILMVVNPALVIGYLAGKRLESRLNDGGITFDVSQAAIQGIKFFELLMNALQTFSKRAELGAEIFEDGSPLSILGITRSWFRDFNHAGMVSNGIATVNSFFRNKVLINNQYLKNPVHARPKVTAAGFGAEVSIPSADEIQELLERTLLEDLQETPEKFVKSLGKLSQKVLGRSITADEIASLRVKSIGYHVSGEHKHVFRIDLALPDTAGVFNLTLALKQQKALGYITEDEVRYLERMNEWTGYDGSNVPVLVAAYYVNNNPRQGVEAIFEEFVEGRVFNEILLEEPENVDRSALNIASMLFDSFDRANGWISTDIHQDNTMVRNESDEAVLVDAGFVIAQQFEHFFGRIFNFYFMERDAQSGQMKAVRLAGLLDLVAKRANGFEELQKIRAFFQEKLEHIPDENPLAEAWEKMDATLLDPLRKVNEVNPVTSFTYTDLSSGKAVTQSAVVFDRTSQRVVQPVYLNSDMIQFILPRSAVEMAVAEIDRYLADVDAVDINKDLQNAREILKNYDVGTIHTVKPVDGGKGELGKALLIETDRGQFKLKPITNQIFAHSSAEDVALYETSAVREMLRRGFPVASPITTLTGKHFSFANGKAYILYDFILGDEFAWDWNYANISPARQASMVRFLAKMHRDVQGFDPQGERNQDSLLQTLKHRAVDMAALKERLLDKKIDLPNYSYTKSERLFLDSVDFILDQFEWLDTALLDSLPTALVHGDLHPGNAVFKGDEVKAAFDWDHLRKDFRLWDLFQGAFNYLNPDALEAALRVYHAENPLTPGEWQAVPVIVRLKLLDLLSRMVVPEKIYERHQYANELEKVDRLEQALFLMEKDAGLFSWMQENIRALTDTDAQELRGDFDRMQARIISSGAGIDTAKKDVFEWLISVEGGEFRQFKEFVERWIHEIHPHFPTDEFLSQTRTELSPKVTLYHKKQSIDGKQGLLVQDITWQQRGVIAAMEMFIPDGEQNQSVEFVFQPASVTVKVTENQKESEEKFETKDIPIRGIRFQKDTFTILLSKEALGLLAPYLPRLHRFRFELAQSGFGAEDVGNLLSRQLKQELDAQNVDLKTYTVNDQAIPVEITDKFIRIAEFAFVHPKEYDELSIPFRTKFAKNIIQFPEGLVKLRDERLFFNYHNQVLLAMLSMMGYRDRLQNKVVLDLGAGTGLLTFLALRLGARRVISVEGKAADLETAKLFAEKNGFDAAGDIEFVNKFLLDDESNRAEEIRFLKDRTIQIVVANVAEPSDYAEIMLGNLPTLEYYFFSGQSHSTELVPHLKSFESQGHRILEIANLNVPAFKGLDRNVFPAKETLKPITVIIEAKQHAGFGGEYTLQEAVDIWNEMLNQLKTPEEVFTLVNYTALNINYNQALESYVKVMTEPDVSREARYLEAITLLRSKYIDKVGDVLRTIQMRIPEFNKKMVPVEKMLGTYAVYDSMAAHVERLIGIGASEETLENDWNMRVAYSAATDAEYALAENDVFFSAYDIMEMGFGAAYESRASGLLESEINEIAGAIVARHETPDESDISKQLVLLQARVRARVGLLIEQAKQRKIIASLAYSEVEQKLSEEKSFSEDLRQLLWGASVWHRKLFHHYFIWNAFKDWQTNVPDDVKRLVFSKETALSDMEITAVLDYLRTEITFSDAQSQTAKVEGALGGVDQEIAGITHITETFSEATGEDLRRMLAFAQDIRLARHTARGFGAARLPSRRTILIGVSAAAAAASLGIGWYVIERLTTEKWQRFTPEPTLESAKQAIRITAQWLKDNGYPHTDVLDRYLQAVENARESDVPLQNAMMGKMEISDRPGSYVILLNSRRIAADFETLQKSKSNDLFMEEFASIIVNEAFGNELFLVTGSERKEVHEKTQHLLAEGSKMFVVEGKFSWPSQGFSKFADKYGSEVERMTAIALAHETFEMRHRWEALQWAREKGLYSSERTLRLFEGNRLDREDVQVLLATNGNELEILTRMMQLALSTTLFPFMEGKSKPEYKAFLARYVLFTFLEFEKYRRTSPTAVPQGINSEIVNILRQGKLPSLDMFQNSARRLLPQVKSLISEWENRLAKQNSSGFGAVDNEREYNIWSTRLPESLKGLPRVRYGQNGSALYWDSYNQQYVRADNSSVIRWSHHRLYRDASSATIDGNGNLVINPIGDGMDGRIVVLDSRDGALLKNIRFDQINGGGNSLLITDDNGDVLISSRGAVWKLRVKDYEVEEASISDFLGIMGFAKDSDGDIYILNANWYDTHDRGNEPEDARKKREARDLQPAGIYIMTKNNEIQLHPASDAIHSYGQPLSITIGGEGNLYVSYGYYKEKPVIRVFDRITHQLLSEISNFPGGDEYPLLTTNYHGDVVVWLTHDIYKNNHIERTDFRLYTIEAVNNVGERRFPKRSISQVTQSAEHQTQNSYRNVDALFERIFDRVYRSIFLEERSFTEEITGLLALKVGHEMKSPEVAYPFNGRPFKDSVIVEALTSFQKIVSGEMDDIFETDVELKEHIKAMLRPELFKAIIFYVTNNHFIKEGQAFTAEQIAEDLGTTPDLIYFMLLPYRENGTGLVAEQIIEITDRRPDASYTGITDEGQRHRVELDRDRIYVKNYDESDKEERALEDAVHGLKLFRKLKGRDFGPWTGSSKPTLDELITHILTVEKTGFGAESEITVQEAMKVWNEMLDELKTPEEVFTLVNYTAVNINYNQALESYVKVMAEPDVDREAQYLEAMMLLRSKFIDKVADVLRAIQVRIPEFNKKMVLIEKLLGQYIVYDSMESHVERLAGTDTSEALEKDWNMRVAYSAATAAEHALAESDVSVSAYDIMEMGFGAVIGLDDTVILPPEENMSAEEEGISSAVIRHNVGILLSSDFYSHGVSKPDLREDNPLWRAHLIRMDRQGRIKMDEPDAPSDIKVVLHSFLDGKLLLGQRDVRRIPKVFLDSLDDYNRKNLKNKAAPAPLPANEGNTFPLQNEMTEAEVEMEKANAAGFEGGVRPALVEVEEPDYSKASEQEIVDELARQLALRDTELTLSYATRDAQNAGLFESGFGIVDYDALNLFMKNPEVAGRFKFDRVAILGFEALSPTEQAEAAKIVAELWSGARLFKKGIKSFSAQERMQLSTSRLLPLFTLKKPVGFGGDWVTLRAAYDADIQSIPPDVRSSVDIVMRGAISGLLAALRNRAFAIAA